MNNEPEQQKMIDHQDTKTEALNLGPTPKKRGRPATGQAMTAAEKQRAYRERQNRAAEQIKERALFKVATKLEWLRAGGRPHWELFVAHALLEGLCVAEVLTTEECRRLRELAGNAWQYGVEG